MQRSNPRFVIFDSYCDLDTLRCYQMLFPVLFPAFYLEHAFGRLRVNLFDVLFFLFPHKEFYYTPTR
jgi:hypothetical protein